MRKKIQGRKQMRRRDRRRGKEKREEGEGWKVDRGWQGLAMEMGGGKELKKAKQNTHFDSLQINIMKGNLA